MIGLDSHPDSFTAAVLRGTTPASAVVDKMFNKLPMVRLRNWAEKSTTNQDLIVLEASGNSFQVARVLAACRRKVKVLESCHLGKLKEAHANNDKISAVRIAKAYLAGTAKEVWVPDLKTQERRDWFHAYRKATKRTTQLRARLRSYLSDNGVRLKKGSRLSNAGEVEEQIRKAQQWSARQWQVIELLLAELRHANQQRIGQANHIRFGLRAEPGDQFVQAIRKAPLLGQHVRNSVCWQAVRKTESACANNLARSNARDHHCPPTKNRSALSETAREKKVALHRHNIWQRCFLAWQSISDERSQCCYGPLFILTADFEETRVAESDIRTDD